MPIVGILLSYFCHVKQKEESMNALVNNLSTTDQVLAILERDGQVLASVSKRDFKSVNEVVRFLISLAGRFAGLAKLTIRNKTQGWSTHMTLASPFRRPPMPSIAALAPREGRQYLIPW